MNSIFLSVFPGIESPFDYVMGAIIALVVLGYLLYSLVKPEKF